MTDQFVSAADEMRRALGMPDYPFATVEHPISSASNRALEQRAESVLAQGLPVWEFRKYLASKLL